MGEQSLRKRLNRLTIAVIVINILILAVWREECRILHE